MARLSCDRDIFLLGAGSGGLEDTHGSGASQTALRNFGLQLDARSRFSFSRTTGQSDLAGAGAGFLANRLDEASSLVGGCGAIRRLFVERVWSVDEASLSSSSSSSRSSSVYNFEI